VIRTETAYAKVNLALHVRRRRADGYHELETVFAFCEDGDVLTAEPAEPADTTTLTIDGPFADGLSITDNLVVRAAQATGVSARLHLTKNLPVASGIGGGSADAAAALRLLSNPPFVARDSIRGLASSLRSHEIGSLIPDRVRGDELGELLSIARSLGADVPACVLSETMRGEGVGEALSPVASVAGTPILLVNPRVPLSTAAVFKGWDGVDRGPLGDWRDGRNDLEAPACTLVPEIAELIAFLVRRHDVTMARMSGSGATCFALFATEVARANAVTKVKGRFPDYWTMESVLR
jgi:4-diphosphocytidyl-2-C-methyl-D-erythritol kinase